MNGTVRKRVLTRILFSQTVQQLAPRLLERLRQRRVVQDFRAGRVGAAAAATRGRDVDAFCRHLGARRKIPASLRARIARALQAYGPVCDQWRTHIKRCEEVFWEAPPDAPAPHAERERLHHDRRRLSHACQRPQALFDFLLRRRRFVAPVKFCVAPPGELRRLLHDELARPELL